MKIADTDVSTASSSSVKNRIQMKKDEGDAVKLSPTNATLTLVLSSSMSESKPRERGSEEKVLRVGPWRIT